MEKVMGWLFVYGTLKVGYGNHDLIEDLVVEVEPAMIVGEMYDLGWFPGVLLTGNGNVIGEAVLVNDLDEAISRCNALEGYRPEKPELSHYLLKEVIATLESGSMKKVFMYEYNYPKNTINKEPIDIWPVDEKGRLHHANS